jgi:adenylate kinase
MRESASRRRAHSGASECHSMAADRNDEMTIAVIFLGPPGAGKGTQAAILAHRFRFVPINSGELLRREVDACTEVGRAAADHMRRGDLVPDDVVTAVIANGLRTHAGKRLVIEGYPKTVRQAEAVHALLEEVDSPVAVAIDFVVDRTELRRRLLGRAHESARQDDRPATIERRLDRFGRTSPELLAYYRRGGMLAEVDARPSTAIVAASVATVVTAAMEASKGGPR